MTGSMDLRPQRLARRRWAGWAGNAIGALALAIGLAACGGGGDVASTVHERPTALSSTSGPVTGAIFTTNQACNGVDLNIYTDKDAVYLDGGPRKLGTAGLPDGEYYVQVTQPGPEGQPDTLLGTSLGTADETPVVVSGGEFVTCYQLSLILRKASDSTPGYDDTGNPGGEYKVWVSTVATFDNNQTKTDNFKVKSSGGGDCDNPGPNPQDCPGPIGTLQVLKFYDANADGIQNNGEVLIDGWKVAISDISPDPYFTPVSVLVAPGTYSVSEFMPLETNWLATTPSPVSADVAAGGSTTVTFGNVCVGAGGGLTLGFWSNKNGQALIDGTDLTMLVNLNLVDAAGAAFNPASYAALRTWLLNATATNMAYMLSAQLAAMELNVFNGKVGGGSLVYVGTTWNGQPISFAGLNALGYASVNDLMAAANASLATDPLTVASGTARNDQEALKNALDAANNNRNFVQATACPFTF